MDILVPLNRPQYVPSPETLISALAEDVLAYEDPALDSVGRRFIGAASSGRTEILQTSPATRLGEFDEALRLAGLQHELKAGVAADAVVRSIAGVRARRSKAQAASPMTPGLALLQNPVGMTGAAQPPNFAGIVKTMFWLGSPPDADPGSNISELWLEAARRRLASDSLLTVIDRAFVSLYGEYAIKPSRHEAITDTSPPGLTDTPYGWMHDAWLTLVREEWIEALPPRVWVDWATTVLRLGLAFGYLWECERYWRICQAALQGVADPLNAGMPPAGSPFELLAWDSSHLPVSSRNVRAVLRKRVYVGGRLRAFLDDALGQNRHLDSSELLRNEEFLEDLQRTLERTDEPRFLKNLHETVIYSLLRRDSSDHYGLLVARGNAIAVVDPGTEWVALVASLAAGRPGTETHVGRVVHELGRLGLQPGLKDLVDRLEAAGLARGSADADHGVRVASAY